MAPVRRLVVDVLKPHDPSLLAFTERLSQVDGVEGVTGSLVELDKEVQNVMLTFEGPDLSYETIETAIEETGATVHSVDEVACGEYVVEDRPTQQDT